MHANDDPKFQNCALQIMRKPEGVFYQCRLSLRLGRKTIGLGSDKLAALNALAAIDQRINEFLSANQDVDLDTLKAIASQNDQTKKPIKVIQKDDLQVLWDNYVSFHTALNCWEETYVLTHIKIVTSLVKKCPHQKIDEKNQIVQWFFGDKKRTAKTSKDRFKLVVAAIDWNAKQGNIPRHWGIEYRDLLSSINVKVSKSKVVNNEDDQIEIFSVKEVYQILEAFKNESFSRFKGKHFQYYKFVYFLWLTGCRPNEAVALKWENVNLLGNKITFKEGEVTVSGKRIKKAGTKTVNSRQFPLNGELKELLESIPSRSGYVFESATGNPISHQQARRVWNQILDNLGLKHRNLYQLRHTMISYHANNDFPLHKLAELVGNSEAIIKEHYLKLNIERIVLPDVIKLQ